MGYVVLPSKPTADADSKGIAIKKLSSIKCLVRYHGFVLLGSTWNIMLDGVAGRVTENLQPATRASIRPQLTRIEEKKGDPLSWTCYGLR